MIAVLAIWRRSRPATTGPRSLTFAEAVREIADATGREPRDFADFARRTAATGVWDA